MNVVAWDPGAKGAFAFRTGGRVKTVPFPDDDEQLARLIQMMLGLEPVTVVYESQTGCAGIRTSAPAMFKYGTGFGKALGAISMYSLARTSNGFTKIEMLSVTANKWQPSFDLDFKRAVKRKDFPGTEKEYQNYKAMIKRERKGALRDHAAKAFQSDHLLQPVTLDNCDALLLLKYGEQIIGTAGDR